jgi:hypothetical protein
MTALFLTAATVSYLPKQLEVLPLSPSFRIAVSFRLISDATIICWEFSFSLLLFPQSAAHFRRPQMLYEL